MEGKSLWGTIPDAESIKTPFAILKEQGAILESLTNSLLVSGFNIESSAVDNFQVLFKIVAPTLGNYSVAIVRIQHKISIYPVSIWKLQGSEFSEANNQDEFEKIIGKILQSEEISGIIRSMLNQIDAADQFK